MPVSTQRVDIDRYIYTMKEVLDLATFSRQLLLHLVIESSIDYYD